MPPVSSPSGRHRCRCFGRRGGRRLVLLALLGLTGDATAQGVGPQTNFLTPVGLHTLTTVYMESESNFRFGQTLIDRAEIDTSSVLANYAYRFSAAGRFAQFTALVSHQEINAVGEVGVNPENRETVVRRLSGVTDPLLSIRVGLIGAPALSPEEWLAAEKGFQLYAEYGLRVPLGDYESTRFLNPGFNRYAQSLSVPMVIPLDRGPGKTFLELRPEVTYFTNNDDPPGEATLLEQDPLYVLEFHVSRFLTPDFWLSLGLHSQWGGETIADGRPSGNRLEQFFAEGALGYAVNRNIALSGTYGRIIGSSSNTRGKVWRVRLLFAF